MCLSSVADAIIIINSAWILEIIRLPRHGFGKAVWPCSYFVEHCLPFAVLSENGVFGVPETACAARGSGKLTFATCAELCAQGLMAENYPPKPCKVHIWYNMGIADRRQESTVLAFGEQSLFTFVITLSIMLIAKAAHLPPCPLGNRNTLPPIPSSRQSTRCT